MRPFSETENFSREELGCDLHPFLLFTLQKLRAQFQKPITINRSLSTFSSHVQIYEDLYGDKWPTRITLNSAHLPQVLEDGAISPYGHAVDFSMSGVSDHRILVDRLNELFETDAKLYFPKEVKAYGLGIAKSFIHLDCATHRKAIAIWNYS